MLAGMDGNNANGEPQERPRPMAETLAAIAVHLLRGEDYRVAAHRALALLVACREELDGAPVGVPLSARSTVAGRAPAPEKVHVRVVGQPIYEDGRHYQRDDVFVTTPVRAASLGGHIVQADHPSVVLPPEVEFQKLVNYVTGRTGGEARKNYRDFLLWYIRAEQTDFPACGTIAEREVAYWTAVDQLPETSSAELDRRWAREKARTFTREEAERLAYRYRRWQARNLRVRNSSNGKKGGRGKKSL